MVPFQLRLPEDLHERLKGDAVLNRRSLHAEILVRLERPARPGGVSSEVARELVAEYLSPDLEEPLSEPERKNAGAVMDSRVGEFSGSQPASSGSESVGRRAVATPFSEIPRKAKPKRRARSVRCEHRVPATEFCKRCD